MWLHKFSRLLYIAYLDCERSIKNISFVVIGILTGFMFFSLFVPNIEMPLFSAYLVYSLVTIATMNALLVTATVYFWILIAIFSFSVFNIAYLYDNKSWGYVHSAKGSGHGFREWVGKGVDKFNRQAKIDEEQTKLEHYHHNVLIEGLVEELKKE
jgi:hypothetical protein